jgi:signal transduction histidine kinase
VQDLKDFSRVDARQEWEWANLHKGIDSTLNIVNNEIKYKADVIKDYANLPDIECLPSELNQVFMNLLVNAAHAIESERGTITIRTGVTDGHVTVEIADTGTGIAVENLQRIFDPFFTTKPVGKGTGLGLSLAYGIVKKHHGQIEVESQLGRGTTFRLSLPIRRPAGQSQ